MSHPYRWVIVAAGGLLGCFAAGMGLAARLILITFRPLAMGTRPAVV